MSISSIVQIAGRLLNRNLDEEQQNQGKSQALAGATREQTNQPDFGGDRFTPSQRNDAATAASDTGFLQVEQLRFTAVNAGPAVANPNPPTPAPNAAVTNAVSPAPANSVSPPGGVNTAPVVTTPATATPSNAGTAVAPPAATPTTSTTTSTPTATQAQQDLQSLNSSLQALGLNAAEIAAFDQFAGVLLQFDPNGLQDLENQLNLLAAQFQAGNAAPTPAAATQAPVNAQTAATPQTPATTQGPAPTPSYQLSELSVSFTGVQGTLNQSGQNGGAGSATQFAAFNLQIQEVRVSLTNPAGQTTQLQVPQPVAATAAATAPAAKAATA
jgi:hypothetical protein